MCVYEVLKLNPLCECRRIFTQSRIKYGTKVDWQTIRANQYTMSMHLKYGIICVHDNVTKQNNFKDYSIYNGLPCTGLGDFLTDILTCPWTNSQTHANAQSTKISNNLTW